MTKAVSEGKMMEIGGKTGKQQQAWSIWVLNLIFKQICKSEIKLKYVYHFILALKT